MPDGSAPIATGISNARQGSEVDAKVAAGALLFYRPQTNELLLIPADRAAAFENECRGMDYVIHGFREAKAAYLQAADELLMAQRGASGPERTVPQDPQMLVMAEHKMKVAESTLKTSQQAVEDKIKPLGTLDGTGDKILELIPIYQRRTGEGKGAATERYTWGRKWTYVRSDKVKNHFRSYKLNAAERSRYQGRPGNTILREDGKIDVAKLGKQLSQLEATGKLKEISAGGFLVPNLNAFIKQELEAWANGINAGNHHVELSVEAQLLRYFAGAGLQTEWSPKEGRVALRGNARGEFAVAEGKCKAGCYWPDRAGVQWALTGPKSGKTYPIGLVRLATRIELYGLAGASAVAELDVEVDYTSLVDGKAGMTGASNKGSLRARQIDLTKKTRDGASVNAGAEAFAGVKAGGSITGAIEWNSPEKQGFEDLAFIGPGVGIQAGLALGGQATITFIGGKFRILVAASACFGVGARGKLELEVELGKTLEMMKYLSYALYATNYEFMEILTEEGFQAWQGLTLWLIQTGGDIEEALAKLARGVDLFMEQLAQKYRKEEARVSLMEGVLRSPVWLDYCPPETKGQILYQLTRHSKLTKTTHLLDNQGWNLAFLKRRKEAVLVVCRKARSKADFRNMMQHMTEDGSAVSDWVQSYEHVQRFLAMGYDPEEYRYQIEDVRDSLAALYSRLYDSPINGYAFIDNNAPQYIARSSRGEHPGYMIAGGHRTGPEAPDSHFS